MDYVRLGSTGLRVSPICLGMMIVDHLEQAVGALDVTLTDDDVDELTQPYLPQPVQAHT